MQFNSFVIHLESDGFRIENPGHNVPTGTPLVVYYELPNGWESVQVRFQPTGWSILHPFTHSGMFIYTGQEPIRVVVKLASYAPTTRWTIEDDGYPAGMLCCYPSFSDDVWSDGSLQTISDDVPQPPAGGFQTDPMTGFASDPLPMSAGGAGPSGGDGGSSILLEDPDPVPAPSNRDSVILEDPDPSDPNAY